MKYEAIFISKTKITIKFGQLMGYIKDHLFSTDKAFDIITWMYYWHLNKNQYKVYFGMKGLKIQ